MHVWLLFLRHGDRDNIVAGWNDIVKEKHSAARVAYLDWVADGRPRNGPLFTLMSRTRASFKLALRYCKVHEEMMRADACAKNLANRDFRSFCRNVNKYNNGNCTKYVSTVGGRSGKENITKMWCDNFEQLYNSVADDGFKRQFYDRIMPHKSNTAQYVITIHTLLECLHKQKFGKAVGLDGTAMEVV